MENIETCNILGVNVSCVDMKKTINYVSKNIEELSGKYICVSNVHTTIMSYENAEYRNVQNSAIMVLPDGKPLSILAKKRGYQIDRVTGPDLMEEIFKISGEKKYKHFFYGSTEETLNKLNEKLKEKYPKLEIVGMYSPPFRKLNEQEDTEIIKKINDTNPDFVWIGLGAPKQENWMYEHKDKINGLMIGVGAGFDYHADNIKRAPKWMQKCSLEWLYRLLQDPKRLLSRYFKTNLKFLGLVIRGK